MLAIKCTSARNVFDYATGPKLRQNAPVLQVHRLDEGAGDQHRIRAKRHAIGMQINEKVQRLDTSIGSKRMRPTGRLDGCQKQPELPGSTQIDARRSITSSRHKKNKYEWVTPLPDSSQNVSLDEFDPDTDLMYSCGRFH